MKASVKSSLQFNVIRVTTILNMESCSGQLRVYLSHNTMLQLK